MKTSNFKLIAMLLLVLAVFSVFALTGCNGPQVSDIYVAKSGMPKLVYVQGQEFDVSGGVLTVVTDGEESSIPMNSEGVSISGYDKEKLGKQTVTVTYMEKTVNLEVNVIARMVAESYEENYFVGDSFNANKGKIRLARDNGTTFNVNLNDKGVEIVSFDSSKAGTTAVAVKYTANDGKVYEGSFNVKVHGIGDVKFVAPYKKEYSSHETKVDTNGCYFTVTSDSDNSFFKHVPATDEMVSGFKPEEVTIENREVPVNQTLVFSYAGKSFDFPITVIFSPLSIFNERAEALKVIDWSADTVTIEDELGEAALDAIQQYYKLTDAEKKLITTEALRNVVRPAALYVNRLYYKASVDTLGENIYIGTDAGFSIRANCTYENVVSAIENLNNEDDLFNVYAELLRNIKKDFASMVFKDNIKISSYIVVHNEDDRLYVLDLLDHLVKLHNTLSVIDDETEWTVEDLAEYDDVIQDVVSKIRNGQYVGSRYSLFYSILSSWRKNDDFFEIIYSYYLYGDDDMKSLIAEELWMQVPLPGILEDWYNAIVTAYTEEQVMYAYADSDAYLYDTSAFFYYYYETERLVKEIKASENQLYIDLYEHLTCDLLFTQYLRNSTYGYLYHFDKMIDSERFVETWDTYVELIRYYLSMTGAEDEVIDPAPFVNMMNALVDLTPTELNAFIGSLHFLYRTSRGSALVFEYDQTVQSTLVMLLVAYYEEELGEEAAPLYQHLLLAMENLSLIGIKDTAKEDFKASMKALIDGQAALVGDARDAFDNTLGDIYAVYCRYYEELCRETGSEIPAEFAADFAELYELLRVLEEVEAFLVSDDETLDKDGVHSILFAIYERIEDIRNSLIESGNETVVTVFTTKIYEFTGTELTLDRATLSARAIFIRFLINSTITQNKDGVETVHIAWDFYKNSAARDFLADLADMFKSYFKNEALDDSVLTLMAAFRALPDNVRAMIFTFDADITYYKAIERYFETVLANDGELVSALLEAEALYNKYITTLTAEDLAAFCDKVTAVGELYITVSDKATFDSTLLDMYNYYLEIAEKLSAAEEE